MSSVNTKLNNLPFLEYDTNVVNDQAKLALVSFIYNQCLKKRTIIT